jgi:predicted double-glycine peptidase
MRGVRLLLLTALLFGCSTLPKQALRVPSVAQTTNFSCGAASLAAVLRYWKVWDGQERDLWPALHTTEKDGTEPRPLADVARAHGLLAAYRRDVTIDELRAAVARGETVILDLQAWADKPVVWRDDWDDGHYVVLVAIDPARIYYMDPSEDSGYGQLPISEFVERWHDAEIDGSRYQHMAIFVHGAGMLK